MIGERPTGDDKQALVSWLTKQISYYSNLYYNQAISEISDADFDSLWSELKRLDPQNPQLEMVGSDSIPGSKKVTHLFPMRSLDKATTIKEIPILILKQLQMGNSLYVSLNSTVQHFL